MRRGWIGPGSCTLCRQENEFVNHLFALCNFSLFVWKDLKVSFGVNQIWGTHSLEENFSSWRKRGSNHKNIPIFVCWDI